MSTLKLYKTSKDHIRKNLIKYTRRAFESIPKINDPNILDIGCGTGIPTIELARIFHGHILGIDFDESSLDCLIRKIQKMGLNNQIKVLKDSIQTMDLSEESFDIIWAEGSLFILGFEKSIKMWYRFLKPKGFLVVHDQNKDKHKKLELLAKYNYKTITSFDLTPDLWQLEYYTPLEQLVRKFRYRYSGDPDLIDELNKDQFEIDRYKVNSVVFSSFFAVSQKI